MLAVDRDGVERRVVARAVIDASGTWGSPTRSELTGWRRRGSAPRGDVIAYRIPDVLGRQRRRYAGRTVAVVGSGHSAQNAVNDLAALARHEPGTRVLWVVRRDGGRILDPGRDEQLPAREQLQAQAQQLVTSGAAELVTGFRTDRVSRLGSRRVVLHDGERQLPPADEVIAATGFRPDLALLRELRLDLDPALESPRPLASLIDPDLHGCATVPPHGAWELAHPERGVYVVGAKSYARAPTFLTASGYEQVRSVVAEIADEAVTPPVEAQGSCCASAPTLSTVGGCGGAC